MLNKVWWFFRYVTGVRRTDVERESQAELVLNSWPVRTVLDKKRGQITQNRAVLATLSSVDRVELQQGRDQDFPLNWLLTIYLKSNSRGIEVGKSTDGDQASIVAAKIARFIDVPVTSKT